MRTTEASDPKSLSGRVDAVYRAWRDTYAKAGEPSDSWPVETYEDAVIVQTGDGYQRYPYTYASDGAVTFGDPEPVTPNVGYTPEAVGVLALSADRFTEAGAKTKTEDGQKYPASDYAYVPDPDSPSGWKLRLTSTPGGAPDPGIVGAAVAALGKGFRGQKVQIPAEDLPRVKARVRAAWHKAHPDAKPDDMPDALTEAGLTRFAEPLEAAGRILESVDGIGPDGGRVWRITMIRPGVSANGRRYRPEVLAEAAALYEGAKAFDGHRTDAERDASAVRNLAGWHTDVEAQSDGSLQSTLHVAESAPHVRSLLITAYESKNPNLVGFSHDVSGTSKPVAEGGRLIRDVTKIVEVHSVDIVADPAAGGRLERLVASRQKGEIPVDLKELHEFLDGLSDEDRAAALAKYNATVAPAVTPAAEPVVEAAKEKGKERILEAGSVEQRFVLTEALSATNLPEDAKTKIRRTVTEGDFTEAAILTKIAETKDLWDAVLAARPQPLPGQRITVTEVGAENRAKALDGLFSGETVDGIRPFRSLREAFAAFSGYSPYDTEDFNRRLLAESVGAFASTEDQRRLRESIISSTWSSALGDSITRRAIAEYQDPSLASWKLIVSDTPPITDFRTQRRDRIGGYDVLTVVAEKGTYPALTSPTDEEATYSVTKKGGTEDLTLEVIANDDIGAVRRIPKSLGRAAALTLYRAVWQTTLAANALIYDGVALFDSTHANTTAAALGETGIGTLRNLMVTQTRLGESSGFLMATPKFLVVPSELFVTAFKLTQSGSSVAGGEAASNAWGAGNIPNPWQGLVPIEVPIWTDADDWLLVADPKTIPTIEVGFYLGREDPEILIQDAPAVGSVFTADTITYKVRHIWGLTVLDYRGFQRGTQ